MIKNFIKRFFNSSKFSSKSYWEQRYKAGGNSGSGSYNRLAQFKAEVINQFVTKYNIQSIIELGCGDGNQLKFYDFKRYIGVDVSRTAINNCKEIYKSDGSKEFLTLDKLYIDNHISEMSMSIDIIYHLIEDEVFEEHLKLLFSLASKYIAIYSTDIEGPIISHERNRCFTKWIEQNINGWHLIDQINNKYPYDPLQPDDTSNAHFYLYKKSN